MNKVILVLVIIISLLAGAILGAVVIKQSKQCLQQAQTQVQNQPQQTANPFTSKVIVGIDIAGKVTSIKGKTITVSIDKDSSQVEVPDNATILFYGDAAKDPKTGKTVQEGIKAVFADIKVGQTIYARTSVLPDGTLQASSFFITAR